MEEKHRGQPVDKDYSAVDRTENQGGRAGAEGTHTLKDAQRDLELLKQARDNAEPSNEAMEKAGFGDDKGTKGI